TDQTDPPWEDLYRWLRLLPSNELETIKQQFEGDDNALGIPFDDANPLSNLNDDRQSALNIPNEFLPDESFISVRDQKGLAFEDSKGGYLPTGVHMMMPRESFQHMKAKKEGLIQFSSIDSRCQEERAFQLVKGFISEVQARDTSPWAPKIKSLVDFSSQSSEWKYTHGRFNRRYFAQGIYASGRVFEEKGLITVAVDVSGSIIMMPDMLETVFGVVDDLTRKYTVQLVCVDEQLFIPEKTNDQWTQSTKADKPYIYSRGDWKYIKTGSMRTTFFSPLFNDYMKRHREMLLVITDGQIYDLEKLKPYYPTLWIIPEEFRQRFTEPFGQVVSIDSNNCAA
ncbi:hypothetical protein KKA14_17120, partial [bacterium]|nr:hypothetical protein [bacterium]